MKQAPVHQSCVVPYREGKNGVEFALITSRNTRRGPGFRRSPANEGKRSYRVYGAHYLC